MPLQSQRPLIIWRLTDGKPGHEKQSQGLANALARIRPCNIHTIRLQTGQNFLLNWLSRRFPPGTNLPAPDIIVSAGHATHLAMLAARRAHGGKIVVLMRPSLPLGLFDLCLIPEHDSPPQRSNVILTLGALNNLTPSGKHAPDQGLILVGGPSSHFQWDSHAIARQIGELAQSRAEMKWTLTTSRRTPADFLCTVNAENMDIHPVETTAPGWLEGRLSEAGEVWVTPDSVSMVYEALTAGCHVGLLELPAKHGSRVASGVMSLIAKGYVSMFPQRIADRGLGTSTPPLMEARRCAELILKKWFP